MPEEKKKESFTFSDKIKDSKSNKAASKSFAKRISSRIGRDGKPRQTIFERTKRDAPFLIAALIALLLLPFLYKYSGSVKEETVLTPSSTETVFDPERYAFAPDIEDPEGQISQLSGRDSLSLIKGFGSDSEEDEYGSSDDYDYKAEALAQRDAYKESASAKKLKADTNIDIEENTTNIYKKRARAGTRAAFKRAATKINPLNNGARTARTSGSPLGVGKWGGALKNAAKKVKGDGAKNSPKPVSLQPLQAAGKPSRSAFGNPAAALRQSKDALGQGDAKQAILDAQMKPVEPGSFGGLTAGEAKFGGGSGNFDRKFNYQGKEPWWWDLMKTRSQALWQRKMQRKWNWEDWLDKWAQNILGKLMNCLITGSDEGDVDHFLYAKAGDGDEAKCCGKKESDFHKIQGFEKVPFEKGYCNNNKGNIARALGKKECDGWTESKKAEADMNFFQLRGRCLGLTGGSTYAKGEPFLSVDCSDLDTGAHRYVVSHNGKARKWQKNTYVYVVARNYVPVAFEAADRAKVYAENKKWATKQVKKTKYSNMAEGIGDLYAESVDKERIGMRLCSVFGNNLRATKKSSAGTAAIYTTTTEMLAEKYDLDKKAKAHLREMERAAAKETNNVGPYEEHYGERSPQMPERLYKEMEDYAVAHAGSIYKSANASWARAEEYDPESLDDACVIYQAQAISLDWEKHFKPQVISLFMKMLEERGLAADDRYEKAVEMFNNLDLMFVGSMSSEHQLAHRRDILDSESLPMPFWEFKAAYLDRYGVTAKHKDTGDRSYIGNGKYRTDGEDTVYAEKCYFHNSVNLSCLDNTETPTAIVTFTGESYKGGKAGVYYENGLSHLQKDYNFTEEKKNIRVTAEYTPLDGSISGVEQTFYNPRLADDKGNQLVYTFSHIVGVTTGEKGKEVKGEKPAVGRVTWKLFRGSNPEAIDSATCDVGTYGDIPGPAPVTGDKTDECATGGMNASEECCDKLHNEEWEDWTYENGKCKEVKEEDNSNRDNKRNDLIPDGKTPEDENPDGSIIRLATVLSWVPNNGATDCREDAPKTDDAKKESTFRDCGKVPEIKKDVRERCGEQNPLIMDSTAAANYAKKVIEKYNETEPGRKMAEEFAYGRFPTDGEFVDALFLAQELGDGSLANVPGDAVCELGRDMIRMSRDPQVGTLNSGLPTHYTDDKGGGKKYPTYFHNDLGAFLVYISKNAQLYPANRLYSIRDNADRTEGMDKVHDLRFLPEEREKLFEQHLLGANNIYQYNWRNYARVYPLDGGSTIWGARNGYKKSLLSKFKEVNVITDPPLKALVGTDISGLPHEDCGLNETIAKRCDADANKYRLRVNPYLTEDGGFVPWEGNACSVAKDKTVPLKDVLRYVTAVCETGLDAKPYAVGRTGHSKKSTGKRESTNPAN